MFKKKRKDGKKRKALNYQEYMQDSWRKSYKDITDYFSDIDKNQKSENVYQSPLFNKIAGRLVTNSDVLDEEELKKDIRTKLYRKNKDNSPFTLLELEDFCHITNQTPNDILRPDKNIHLVDVLTEEGFKEIKENFAKTFPENTELRFVCLSFPILGLSCIISIKNSKKLTIFETISAAQERKKAVSQDPEILFELVSVLKNNKLLHRDYASEHGNEKDSAYKYIYGIFCCQVVELMKEFNISQLIKIPSLKKAVKNFYDTDFFYYTTLYNDELSSFKEIGVSDNFIE